MSFTVDRIENEVVVLEDENGNFLNQPLSMFLEKVKDGDVVIFENDMYKISKNKTEDRMTKIKNLRKSLEKKN